MIRIDVRGLDGALEKLSGLRAEIRDRALPAALNRTADKGRAEMVRAITAEFAIKAGDVRAQVSVRRASAKWQHWQATLQAFGKRRGRRSRNVMLFGARQTKTGVSVLIKRAGGRKIIKSAWIGNQGRTVFQRIGRARLPIQGVETIDVPQMFNTRRINARVVTKIQRDFGVELDRAVRAFTDRFNRA